MTSGDHLTNGLLVRAIDKELPESEAPFVATHLSRCSECKQRYEELAVLSSRIETLIGGIEVGASYTERERLKKTLEPQEHISAAARSTEKLLRRLGWGIAAAATLAIGIILVPHARDVSTASQSVASQSHNSETFEVDGETFIALPYSNADLPLNAPRIVQMRVPVSSLAAAGVTLQPISSEASTGDDSVLTDVLLGIDDEPLGVHLVGIE